MSSRSEIPRRSFLTSLAGVTALVMPPRVGPVREREDPSVITKRVEKLYTVPGCRQPNDLQFTSEGLWILDQVDQPGNKVFLVNPETGTVIREIMTDSIHGSGITPMRAFAVKSSAGCRSPTHTSVVTA
jgi:hypothetical protein